MRNLEEALAHAMSKGMINADNLNYSADLSMTILECRAFLQELRTLKAALRPFALIGQDFSANLSDAHKLSLVGQGYRSDLFDANVVASSGQNAVTIGDCRRAANVLCLGSTGAAGGNRTS